MDCCALQCPEVTFTSNKVNNVVFRACIIVGCFAWINVYVSLLVMAVFCQIVAFQQSTSPVCLTASPVVEHMLSVVRLWITIWHLSCILRKLRLRTLRVSWPVLYFKSSSEVFLKQYALDKSTFYLLA